MEGFVLSESDSENPFDNEKDVDITEEHDDVERAKPRRTLKDDKPEDLFKVDSNVDTELIETISRNLEIFVSHSEDSQSRFFTPLEIRLIVERDELTMIKYLEALYDPEVLFVFFPYIVDESSSTVLILEKLKRRSESSLPSGKMHVFSFHDSESKIQSRLIEMIREQNFRVEIVDHEMPKKVKSVNRALFLLELVEELFSRAEMSGNLERNNEKLFKRLSNKVKQPSALAYRQWNAMEVPHDAKIEGRIPKFLFVMIVTFSNAILAILLFFLSSNLFSWLFFSVVLASLIPKVYGSFRYHNHENSKERSGYYQDDFQDPDLVFRDEDAIDAAKKGWADVQIEVFRSPNWLLKDQLSNIHVAANTPMYDESLDELKRTLDSYVAVVREYPFLGTTINVKHLWGHRSLPHFLVLEPTFLIDKVATTYETVMKLMFDEDTLVKKAGVYYVLDGRTKMKRLKNNQVMYHGYWRGMHNRSFNIIWKPKGGGKRDSQLLFLKLIHLGLITKPRDSILYVDADTSFTPLDFGRLYNGLMKDEKAGAACGEIKVRNQNFRNLYTLAQSYEYLVNHMLAKAAESWHGIVLCCPGAWCMYRVEALEALLPKYCSIPHSIREFHRLEQGEDRYQNSLCLVSGWKAIMVKSSVALTHVPSTLPRLTEQRRRWNNSTLENTFVVLKLTELWSRGPLYMIALALDTGGFYLSPSIFLTLFGNSLGAFVNYYPLVIAFYATILLYIMIQLIAGLSLFPIESAPLFRTCSLFGAFLMGVVGLIAVLQMTISAKDQGPLLAGLSVYAAILFIKAWRFGGWASLVLVCMGGLSYVLFLPTFYITFLLYSVTRYDTTSWR